jgi:hypothetical protein
MRGSRGSSPWRWWVTGRCGLAGHRWTEVKAGVSQWCSVWSTENGSWGRDWMRWRDGVLLGALYRVGAASRGGRGEKSVAASRV